MRSRLRLGLSGLLALSGGLGCSAEGRSSIETEVVVCSETLCSGHGTCILTDASVACDCDEGYRASGTDCVELVPNDPCEGVTCSGHGTCTELSGATRCDCDDGYLASGMLCIATSGPCEGVTCSGHGSCEVSPTGPECQCDDGYSVVGNDCTMLETDPCEGVTCSDHGVCDSASGVAKCECEDGYELSDMSCVAVDPCSGIVCSGHGTCVADSGSPSCKCDEGYEASGNTCLAVVGPCNEYPCSPHSTCVETSGTAQCVCDEGYEISGTSCVQSDPCEGVTCSDRGACRVASGLARCECVEGYRAQGTSCVPLDGRCASLDCSQFEACGTGEQSLFVSSVADGTGAGTADQPFATVQSAIDAAISGTVIHVAEGEYTEPVRVDGKQIHLCGGWSSDFSQRNPALYRPILRGNGYSPVVDLVDSRESTLVGFRIREGASGVRVATGTWPADKAVSNPRISNNIIEENGVPTLEESFGGVVLVGGYASISGNLLENNRGSKGSALMLEGIEAVVQANTIRNNVGGSDHGGAVYAATENTIFSYNVVSGNEVGSLVGWGWGGGMIVLGDATLNGNVWTDNYSPSHGGALFVDEAATASISNDLFYANRCSSEGGDAIALDGSGTGEVSHVVATNITVVDQDCPGGSAILMEANSLLVLTNSIIWNSPGTTDIFFQEDNCRVDVSYSDFRTAEGQGANGNVLTLGPGNIDADPLFADSSLRDYHLMSEAGRFHPSSGAWIEDEVTSPAIDSGDPASEFDLEPTPNGGRADMGCYGGTEQASHSGK